jgi:NAD dependent epimerase/dehydratase family enzyme
MLPTPSWVMTTLLGQFGQTLLNSQRGKPAALLQSGFTFTSETLDTALVKILKD